MTEPATSNDYAGHSAFTHPGPYAALIGGLLLDIPALCRTLHGLFIHEAWIEKYGVDAAAFAGQSRTTLPVTQRLEQLLAMDARPLTTARPAGSRALSTCRDFALMLCSVLRHHGVPARVRCGFGRYFLPNPYTDHWVCEYWAREAQRWILVDAQLDEVHQSHLQFDFEPINVPRTAFISGIEAWKLCRSGIIAPGELGRGATAGLFFARVNLARDLLALAKTETSAWDSWREADEPHRALDDAALSQCDGLAQRGERGALKVAPSLRTPPWQSNSKSENLTNIASAS